MSNSRTSSNDNDSNREQDRSGDALAELLRDAQAVDLRGPESGIRLILVFA